MKTIKIILIFLALIGGVVAAFKLPDLINNKSIVVEDEGDYKEYKETSDRIEKRWKEATDWDQKIFDYNCEDIKQISNKCDSSKIKLLRETNVSMASELVRDKVFELWESPSCKRENVKKYINAVECIKAVDSNVKNNNKNIKDVIKVNEKYQMACLFIDRSFRLNAIFDGETGTWNSFDDHSRRIRSEKESIKGDIYYKNYLRNITELKEGLNSVDDKLSVARLQFARSLVAQIMIYYNNIDKNESNGKRLGDVRGKYNKEFGSSDSLNNYVKMYKDELEKIKNENR